MCSHYNIVYTVFSMNLYYLYIIFISIFYTKTITVLRLLNFLFFFLYIHILCYVLGTVHKILSLRHAVTFSVTDINIFIYYIFLSILRHNDMPRTWYMPINCSIEISILFKYFFYILNFNKLMDICTNILNLQNCFKRCECNVFYVRPLYYNYYCLKFHKYSFFFLIHFMLCIMYIL